MADKYWYKLDNAATIVPSATHGSDTRVFRIVCELKEDVDPEVLQSALDKTLEEYPHFRCVLRRGLFWYYLDSCNIPALVERDHLPACSGIYFSGRRSLLFRVTYYHKRINLEMFHALADGTGAFTFLQAIVTNYLVQKHDLPSIKNPQERSSEFEKTDDAFRHFYDRTEGSSQLKNMTSSRAYKITGVQDENLMTHCLEGTVSAKAFIEVAHRYNTTAGVLSTSLFIQSVLDGMSIREQKRPIVVSVPVNLRQYFPSATTRNFFGVINIDYNAMNYDGTLESILTSVASKFEQLLAKENVMNTMNSYSALERNFAIKMIPLHLKDLGITLFTSLAARGTTATMSNLGRIKVAPEIEGYIDRFAAFMATPNMQICVSSFQDRMVFGASSAFEEHTVMLNFFRRLSKLGLEVELATNDYDAAPARAELKSDRAARRAEKKKLKEIRRKGRDREAV